MKIQEPSSHLPGRRTVLVILAAVLALAVGAAVANAKWTSFRAGPMIFKFDGGVVPRALPAHELVPAGISGRFAIETTDGSHVPAFRGGTFEGDRNVVFDSTGLPTCRRGKLEASTTEMVREQCGDAIVGTGTADVEIAFPESQPIEVTSPLLFFNGGTKAGVTTLYVHTYIQVPVPAAILTVATLKRIHDGPYGLRVKTEIPVIAGGAGSVTGAGFTLRKTFEAGGRKHSYLRARCPAGGFRFRILSTEFDIEGLPPGTAPAITGAVTRPCTPKG